jgi:hypothetical protein
MSPSQRTVARSSHGVLYLQNRHDLRADIAAAAWQQANSAPSRPVAGGVVSPAPSGICAACGADAMTMCPGPGCSVGALSGGPVAATRQGAATSCRLRPTSPALPTPGRVWDANVGDRPVGPCHGLRPANRGASGHDRQRARRGCKLPAVGPRAVRGDLIMGRRQLLNLKQLAQRHPHQAMATD